MTEENTEREKELEALRDELRSKTEAFHATVEILKSEKAEIEAALAKLRVEYEGLAAEAASLKSRADKSRDDERMENTLLRERIAEVAAEVARLAINLEGENSPIEQLLAGDVGTPAGEGEARVSLAQRIRNLQGRAR